ncbi:hypothetical protein [Formosa sp. PL04]|uniref:hypothetical protein n=1 Tax=Formosa sp. PL04 TaxID=3081755 RepID=UPI0029811D2D|nr:hypothetical protein [Formosa sp. PL04]MDW5287559.1 hypothetical protein [Formosa sp. PL04]
MSEAFNHLKTDSKDHENHCLDDDVLVQKLIKDKIALTLCLLSNLELKVIQKLEDHNITDILDRGIMATINSDDPTYFGS